MDASKEETKSRRTSAARSTRTHCVLDIVVDAVDAVDAIDAVDVADVVNYC